MRARHFVTLVLIMSIGGLFLFVAWVVRRYDFTSAMFLNVGAGVIVFAPLYAIQVLILDRQKRTEATVAKLTTDVTTGRDAADSRLQEFAARIDRLTEPERRAEAQRRGRHDAAARVLSVMEPGMKAMANELAEAEGKGTAIMDHGDSILRDLNLGPPREGVLLDWWDGYAVGRHTQNRATLTSGVGVQVFNDGTLRLVAAHLLTRRSGSGQATLWHEARLLKVGSPEADQAAGELVDGLREKLPDALAHYVAELEATQEPPPTVSRS